MIWCRRVSDVAPPSTICVGDGARAHYRKEPSVINYDDC